MHPFFSSPMSLYCSSFASLFCVLGSGQCRDVLDFMVVLQKRINVAKHTKKSKQMTSCSAEKRAARFRALGPNKNKWWRGTGAGAQNSQTTRGHVTRSAQCRSRAFHSHFNIHSFNLTSTMEGSRIWLKVCEYNV